MLFVYFHRLDKEEQFSIQVRRQLGLPKKKLHAGLSVHMRKHQLLQFFVILEVPLMKQGLFYHHHAEYRLLISLWDQEVILTKDFVGYGELDGELMYIVYGSDKNNPHVEMTLWISLETTELTKAYIHGLMLPKRDYVDLSVKYDFGQIETKIEKPFLETIFERNN